MSTATGNVKISELNELSSIGEGTKLRIPVSKDKSATSTPDWESYSVNGEVLSYFIKNNIGINNLENNFYVINNSINIEKFLFDEKIRKSIRKELNVKENEILIGHIGRINYQKNQQLLLEAFEKMCENNNNNIKLLFVGTGPMFNELRKNILI